MDKDVLVALIGGAATIIAAIYKSRQVVTYRHETRRPRHSIPALLIGIFEATALLVGQSILFAIYPNKFLAACIGIVLVFEAIMIGLVAYYFLRGVWRLIKGPAHE